MGNAGRGNPFDYIFGTVSIEPHKRNPFEFLSTKILSGGLALPEDITTLMRGIDALPYSGRTQLDDAFDGIANYLLQQKNTIKENTKVKNSKKVTLKVGDVFESRSLDPEDDEAYCVISSLNGGCIQYEAECS